MKIKNKEAWGVFTKDSKGNYVIYESYEEDILKNLIAMCSKKIRILCEDKGATYFEVGNNEFYCICDNGGEFCLEKLNCEPCLSIPYTSYSRLVNAPTMAYRLYKALSDYSLINIDWDFNLEDRKNDTASIMATSKNL